MYKKINYQFDQEKYQIACITKKLKQKDIAAMLGICDSTLYRIVTKGGEFTRSQIIDLCALFGKDVAVSFLFSSLLA